MQLTEFELHVKTVTGKKLAIPVYLPNNYRVGLLAEIKASTVDGLSPQGTMVEATTVDEDYDEDDDEEE